jgi:hypothetical protein
MPSNEPKFLAKFADHRISGMFPFLDVASGWEPELRTLVIYEKDFVAINHGKV